jgi:hypothetical protein
MIIDFQQGIITYPSSGGQQRFLTFNSGYVNLVADNGRTDIAFTHGIENYLHTEYTTVTQAWGPITPNVDAWLYWDIDPRSAVRTFGITYVQPVYGSTQPATPVNNQHWFDTNTNQHKVYRSDVSRWVVVIRVFACKINNSHFSPLGSNLTSPYAGTQVGMPAPGTHAGRIIVDVEGKPIRRSNGLFFTTEDEFFANGSPISSLRLEATVLNATAQENIASHQIVKYTDFGEVLLASYNDTQTTAIAMSMENISTLQAGAVCIQGVITNPNWDWQVVGAPLWIHGSIPGYLTDVDPHVTSALTYPEMKPPVARVLTPQSIYFDQGLGGYGHVVEGNDGGSLVAALDDLTDVTISAPSNNHYLRFNGVQWVNSALNATGFRQLFTATDGQTVFGPINNPYTPGGGQLSVYINGIKQYPGTFVETNSTTVTLTSPSDAGDVVMVEISGITPNYIQDQPSLLLTDLVDVSTTTATMDQYLKFNGTQWINAALPAPPVIPFIPETLDDLTDVVVTTPLVDQYLKYNGTSWVNAVLPATPTYSLDSLTDVVISTPVTNNVLKYNGTSWVNTPVTHTITYDSVNHNLFGPMSTMTGHDNAVYGNSALAANTAGVGNVAVGSDVLMNSTHGGSNVAIGRNALATDLYSIGQIAIGDGALSQSMTTVHPATSIVSGDTVLIVTTGDTDFTSIGAPNNNPGTIFTSTGVGLGTGTFASFYISYGGGNVAIGHESQVATTTGFFNVSIGYHTLKSNTDGYANIAIGGEALALNTTGHNNISVGNVALVINTTGASNVAIGDAALNVNTTGSYNTAIGQNAGAQLTTGHNNTMVGGYQGVAGMAGNVVLSTGDGTVRLQHDGTKWTSATPITMAGLLLSGATSAITLNGNVGTTGQVLTSAGAGATPTWTTITTSSTQVIPIACSDETTGLIAGTGKVTFRMPYAFTLTAIRASLTTAQSTGNIFTVNVRHNGTSVFSTKITIDNTEKTSTTAATPSVLSITNLSDDAEMIVDIDQLGDGTAKGLKVYLIGYNA